MKKSKFKYNNGIPAWIDKRIDDKIMAMQYETFKDNVLNDIGIEDVKIKLNKNAETLTVTIKKHNSIRTKDLMLFLEKVLSRRLYLIDILITNAGDVVSSFYTSKTIE